MSSNQRQDWLSQTALPQSPVNFQQEGTSRLFLVDDHPALRAGLHALIDRHADMTVIGESSDGQQACEAIGHLNPDLVLLDISMPGWSGIQTARYITDRWPWIKILAFTLCEDRSYLREMLHVGVSGYALKFSSTEELLKAIRTTIAGQVYIAPSLQHCLPDLNVEKPPLKIRKTKLSEQEQVVLTLLARGHSNREVAEQLDTSIDAIEKCKISTMKRLNLNSRVDLVHYATARHWLSPA